ncbi:WD repeat-containing protein 55 [Strigops habroptila]|uniref:WD repeat-containing protein 55 n=1 Tax=Strigops habroptila TaxID=2489341 RepID=A0A672UD62_STRHB|nr:WD repeat-containing protein 55 [Strigops habroptila]
MAAPAEDSAEPAGQEPRLRDTPEDICFEATANAIALHPARPLLAAGDVDGDVYLYSYSCTEGENRQLWSSGHHLKSCRDVAFSQDGQKLFTVSKDKAIHILTVEEGRLETRFPKAHSSPLNCVLPIDANVFATGDDNGALKVWDLRKGDAILEARQQEEYISAMAVDGNGKLLLTASGDGTLGVFNVKRRRFELLSEPQNGDLTSVALLKRGRKVACGSSEGTIYLFNWDGFGAASDRFALRAESIDCMVPITDSIVCVGSLDGVIRAVNILPNRVLGCVGQHLGEPIEQLALAPGGQLLASCAHDQKVKFWDVSALAGLVVDDYRKKKKKGGPLRALSGKALGSGEDFFADLRDEPEPEAAAGSDSDSDGGD